jgi:hypothetical protein
MAEPKKTFPMLPIAHWWALRKKFKQSIPGVVTDNYLATVLNMEVRSARANVLPYLKTLGIVDEDGKTLDRAKQWRDDERYPEVCKAMLKDVYPGDLQEVAPNPSRDRAVAERWFANHTGAGQAAVKRMAVLYTVLCEADAAKQPEAEKSEQTRKKVPRQAKSKPGERVSAATPHPLVTAAADPDKSQRTPQGPGININLEIHISADATPDQIDQIFASMAKHIYRHG